MALTRGNVVVIPRPDLNDYVAKLAVEKSPIEWVGPKIFPELLVGVAASKLYYQDWADFGTCQSGRAAGGTVTGVSNVASSNVDYSTEEQLDRQGADESQVAMLGGPVATESVLCKRGLRSIAKKLEVIAVTAIDFGAATDISGTDATVFDGIVAAVNAMLPKVQGQVGTMSLVGGSTALQVLRSNSEVADKMKNIGVQTSNESSVDARRVSNSALAQVFGVRQTLEGADSFWPANAVAVVFCPDPMEDPTESAQVGRLIRYKNDSQTGLISVSEGYDTTTRSDYLDFVTYVDPVVLNEEFIAALQIVATVTT